MALHREENKVPLYAVAEVQTENPCPISYILGQKNRNRRAVWPLREGREIWGVDGAFASISWRRECVRGGVAPSANELAWFYEGFRQCPDAFPKREKLHAALSEPMIENNLTVPNFCKGSAHDMRLFIHVCNTKTHFFLNQDPNMSNANNSDHLLIHILNMNRPLYTAQQ